MTTVAPKTHVNTAVMVVQISEPVSAVRWDSNNPHSRVDSGFTRWADKNDRAEYIHAEKESKLLGQLGKVNFGMIDGDTPVEQGDYILTHSDGFIEVVRPAEFEALYRPASKSEIAAAAETADDSVKIVVLENASVTGENSANMTGETVVQRIKNARQ